MGLKLNVRKSDVGALPDTWSLKELGDVSDLDAGLSKPKIVFGSGCPVVTVQDLYDGETINVSNLKRVVVTEDEIHRYRLFKNDILIGNASVKRDGIGYSNRFDGSLEDVIFAKYAYRARNLRSILPIYLHYVLRTTSCRQWIISNSQTGTLTNLNKAATRAIPVLVPPLSEQAAIAAALSDVDDLLNSLNHLIIKKRNLKQAAMQQLLTGQTRISGFTGKWETKRLGELFSFSGGYSASRDQLSMQGHCYLHYGDIHGSSKSWIDTDADFHDIPKLNISLKHISKASFLEDGDVVFVDASEDDAGTSKHVVIVNKSKKPFISGLHTIVAKSKTDEITNEYRRYCFQISAIRRQFLFYAVGTKVTGISKRNISKLKISLPSPAEQAAIANVLSNMDEELLALEARREKTTLLKQGMMQELLTGKTRLI